MQERVDQTSLSTLTYGNGIAKMIWDPSKGEILEYDEATMEVVLEGDISISIPSIWNIFMDPDAQVIDDVKWLIERVYIDYDEAVARWPEKREELAKCRVGAGSKAYDNGSDQSGLDNEYYNMVELLEYWETGLPTNGYLGRYALTTPTGDEIEAARPSPHRFPMTASITELRRKGLDPESYRAAREKLPHKAFLPYHILTDVDVPGRVLGKSFLDYISQLQNDLNSIDSAFLDYLRANGRAKMLVPKSAEINSMDNSNWDITEYEGAQPPHFMEVPALPSEMATVRQNYLTGINDISGVNESMFGQQSREQSGASMQYATNQGNMIRRRLFNKYVLFVESLYKSYLRLIAQHWDLARIVNVLGKEKALEAVELKGMDVDGGYDVVGEYGVSLSLDPMTRREEILTLQPLFEKANVPPTSVLKMLKLNEMEGLYDLVQMAEDRQREYYEEMIATGKYIAPELWQDHVNMNAWSLQYFMTSEFKYLEEDKKRLCHQHFVERNTLPAKEQQLMQQAGGAAAPGTQAVPALAPAPAPEVAPAPAPAAAPIPGMAG
jgi:hypothetical protein